MAAVLNKQNPIGVAISAWWPGGRIATKALAWLRTMTASTARVAPPTACIRVDHVAGLRTVSPWSKATMPCLGIASSIAAT